ncbi:serine/threonine-protein kinase M1 [Conoideocrella luteorostrata]|uniref:Serine/threonine-protein kinase MEC1 n=1 Tax=Conoideocrella luteorostrata TaxID=1105319 RepID=A0AAJ0FW11_9HYPO|nr:serine/threonine-protein kinase M1 [Conoideocrella luteorostrata]
MAQNFRGNTAPLIRHGGAGGAAGTGDGPPPSTLAAQLVENISTSTKSSRSDESNELKGLFATIQRVKDHPELLSSHTDRVEHNHMLIYVYCRVALESIKLDDPFVNQAHAHGEALKAINFLRFTIKETPSVLIYANGSNTLLYRGVEPLWAWLLPYLLRFLGHDLFQELAGSLEGFLQYLLLLISRVDELWSLGQGLILYLRTCIVGALDQLQNPSLDPSEPKSFGSVHLPSQFALNQILGYSSELVVSRTSYKISSSSQAIRQISSLAKVLAYPLASQESVFSSMTVLSHTIPWLLDTWLDLRNAQKRWDLAESSSPIPIIETVLDVSRGLENEKEMASTFKNKSHALLVLLCTEMRCTRLLRQIIYAAPDQTFDEETSPSYFRDQEVRKSVENLHLNHNQGIASRNFTKKRKTTASDPNTLSCLVKALYGVLDMVWNENTEISIPEENFAGQFSKSPTGSQCLALDLLTRISCVSDGSGLVLAETLGSGQCAVCELGNTPRPIPDFQVAKEAARRTFSNLISIPSFIESRQPRVAAMIALRRLVVHCEDPGYLNLETSGPGQWCLQALNSSIRELRIAAGRTLGEFIRARPLSTTSHELNELVARNRKNSIALLKSTSGQDKDKPHLVETRIMAWGQIGRVVSEDELNLVLIQLVDYLGSSNSIVSAFAFNELVNLAEARSTTPRRLFEPFWKSLAYMATKDMIQRPQRSRAIAELLQISVNDLLLLIQTHALPWLVLDKRQDVIQKIAEARHDENVSYPVMDGPNLASTLALLLVQDTEDIEEFTKSRLNQISSHFHNLPLLHLFLTEPVLIALELLKAASTTDESKKSLVRQALHLVATTVLNANKETKNKKGNVVGRFLQPHILGLMPRLTDVINDSVSLQPPVLEQRICIGALEEMIRTCMQHARIVRPQISACLLSAISQEPLREASLSCWAAMLAHFEEEDVEALLETTFFIIIRYWNVLTSTGAGVAKFMLLSLLKKHGTVVEMHINKLPSLSTCNGLDDVEKNLAVMRPTITMEETLEIFAQRVGHDNSGVVHQALTELVPYLRDNQSALNTSAVSQRPDSAITTVLRSLLDCAYKYNGLQTDISRLCVESMGLIGCLDSNKIETVREKRSIVVLHNFEVGDEMTDFGLFLLEEVLVPSFLSATDTKLQGFLSYAMQQLLDSCDIRAACAMQNTGMVGGNEIYAKWMNIPENVREVVQPFLTSRYMVAPMQLMNVDYPIFHPGKPYGNWLRSFVLDMMEKGQNPLASLLFEPLKRVIRVKDLSTAEFLLPYLVLHILLSSNSSDREKDIIMGELLGVLKYQPADDASYMEREEVKRFCHAVFRCLDYAMRWIQEKRAAGRLSPEGKESVARIQGVLDRIPAELVSQRATDCNEYARALFYLEHHAQKMEQQKREPDDRNRLLERLQDIYANIDEPDGLEGISSQFQALDINQQILSHKKAGRWSAAQTWYEMQLAENPESTEVQIDLLNCLKQAGQHDVLLNHVEGMRTDPSADGRVMPFAVEAAWVTGRWEILAKFIARFQGDLMQDFNMSLATLFDSLQREDAFNAFKKTVQDIQDKITSSMTVSATASLTAAHDLLLKCHVLTDLEAIVGTVDENDRQRTMALLDGRLEIIGGRFSDKQYLLGVRRAAMELSRPKFNDMDISGLWLSSARLARKTNSLHQSFNAVLHASRLGDDSATIENAKLLWRDNHHRKAIQMLQGAIERNKFMTQAGPSTSTSTGTGTGTSRLNPQQKLLTARAQLLLAKWLDAAGQSHAGALREKYQQPPKTYPTWEKGHYYLGRHYKKILESEQPLKADDQSDNYVTGEIARLVIENYLRSLNSGTKYLYQTLPRILTLWLDLGAQVDKPPEGKVSLSRELHKRRNEQLKLLHDFLSRYISKLPAYIFYTALPQIVARIAHPNTAVFERLTHIITKVVEAHPRQALWSLIGIMTTKQVSERKARGTQVLQALRGIRGKVDSTSHDLKYLLRAGEKLAEQLLLACQNGEFHGTKTVHASLSRDLRFQHKCTPCPLVVPVENSLTATLPAVSEHVKTHKAFSRDVVTIECFLDDVLVLSSLAKPRRLTARGSDGKSYMLLIKPKDDLRTDQRLMEFNGIINRSLKRDAESSRRQLYIRTYAVVPLNEECGIIEWVPGIKTMRDILLSLYSSQKVHPDYATLKQLMEEASASESKIRIFTDDVLGRFPPILPSWFIQQFPNPSTWFAARLTYTRSCAVMSMVGTILGLGDRHGENVNLEEGNGGIFHVDFNCLFDKGLTFAKPERVPFRLTHNMVAAMGIYGYEGPFRKSSELTLSILRQQEETLMTILEAFIYDPTLDLQKEKRSSRRGDASIRLQPQSVVDSIRRKVRGLLPNESIPLSVEGQVEELIKQAVDPRNLTAMYIGWCPFL